MTIQSLSSAGPATRILIIYQASCRVCQEPFSSPLLARAHVIAQGHPVSETRHSVIDPSPPEEGERDE